MVMSYQIAVTYSLHLRIEVSLFLKIKAVNKNQPELDCLQSKERTVFTNPKAGQLKKAERRVEKKVDKTLELVKPPKKERWLVAV